LKKGIIDGEIETMNYWNQPENETKYAIPEIYLINFKYEISLAPAFAFRDSK
jgi:hypothetical protein